MSVVYEDEALFPPAAFDAACEVPQCLLHDREQLNSGVRELDPIAGPHEKAAADDLLQPRDMPTACALCNVEGCCSRCEAAQSANRFKYA